MSLAGRWTALRDVPRAELEARPDAVVVTGVGYERLKRLDRVTTGGLHHFFDGDRLEMIYLPRAAVGGTDAKPFTEELGAAEELRSATEKGSKLRVWADHGLAISVDTDETIELAEVFPPTTFDDYRDRIYEEPPAHLR